MSEDIRDSQRTIAYREWQKFEKDAALGRQIQELGIPNPVEWFKCAMSLMAVKNAEEMTVELTNYSLGRALRKAYPGVTLDDLMGVIRCIESGVLPSSVRLARMRGEKENKT